MTTTFRKFYSLLDSRMRLRFLALILIAVAISLADGLSLSLVFPFVTAVQDPTFHERNVYAATVMRWFSLKSHHDLVLFLGGLLLTVFFAKNAFLTVATWVKHRLILTNHVEFQSFLYRGYLRRPYAAHLTRDTAEVLRNCTSSVDLTFATFLTASVNLATEILVIVVIGAVLFTVADISALAVLAAVILVAAFIASILRHRVERWGNSFQAIQTALYHNIQQSLRGVKIVKAYDVEDVLARGFAKAAREGARFRLRYQIASELPRQFLEVVMLAGLLGVLGMAMLRGQPLAEAIAVLATAAVAGFRLVPSINRVITFIVSLKFATAAIDALYDDAAAMREQGLEGQARSLPPSQLDRITFERVTYRYGREGRPSLEEVSLEIRRGEFVGIVGRSGAGKTTLVDLLLGILTPSSGQLLIDGIDMATDGHRLRRLIGYIPQTVHLVNDTIRRNIAFGIPDREIDEVRVKAAVQMSALSRLISELPLGLDTRVGDDGVRLSGGERQRVTIARALYRDPKILVLDEATTALDGETESAITSLLDRMRGNVTIIAVAHRLTTIRRCDRIIFLSDGRIAGLGTFDQLVAQNVDFAALAQHSILDPLPEEEAVSARAQM